MEVGALLRTRCAVCLRALRAAHRLLRAPPAPAAARATGETVNLTGVRLAMRARRSPLALSLSSTLRVAPPAGSTAMLLISTP